LTGNKYERNVFYVFYLPPYILFFLQLYKFVLRLHLCLEYYSLIKDLNSIMKPAKIK